MSVYDIGSTEKLMDNEAFGDAAGRPLIPRWAPNAIYLYGGAGGTGYAAVGQFTESVSQTPEPSTLALLGIGAVEPARLRLAKATPDGIAIQSNITRDKCGHNRYRK